MEDRYLFKAKRLDNGEWVTGNLIQSSDAEDGWEAIIIPVKNSNMFAKPIGHGCGNLGFENWCRVDPSTICQCTGYAGIYEKDIFQWDDEMYVIEWSDYSLSWEAEAIGNTDSIPLGEFESDEIYAIGNTIDNPELLEV